MARRYFVIACEKLSELVERVNEAQQALTAVEFIGGATPMKDYGYAQTITFEIPELEDEKND